MKQAIKELYPLFQAMSKGFIMGFAVIGIALEVPRIITIWAISGNWFLEVPASIGFVAIIILAFVIQADIQSLFHRKTEAAA